MKRIVIAGASAGLLALLAACGSSETSTEAATPAPSVSASETTPEAEPSATDAAMPAGAYIDYADYKAGPQAFAAGDVVLFFNATWCPTCQEAVKNLESADFPDGLTVVSGSPVMAPTWLLASSGRSDQRMPPRAIAPLSSGESFRRCSTKRFDAPSHPTRRGASRASGSRSTRFARRLR